MEKKYDDLSSEYAISAKMYFQVLRLAIAKVDNKWLEASVDIARYAKSAEVYRVACNILNAMYRVGRMKTKKGD